jgi:hypothetical protein
MMPSLSWREWNTTRTQQLNDIEAAHRSVGGTGRGRRYATEQVNHAYAVLLASQFQGFCRDLHSECVRELSRAISPTIFETILHSEFLFNRGLDRGNANPSTIGSDFNRLGVEFWRKVQEDDPKNDRRRQLLEELNQWRNAIAHQDFDPAGLGASTTLHLLKVQGWRKACNRLALSFDNVMRDHLMTITGRSPW